MPFVRPELVGEVRRRTFSRLHGQRVAGFDAKPQAAFYRLLKDLDWRHMRITAPDGREASTSSETVSISESSRTCVFWLLGVSTSTQPLLFPRKKGGLVDVDWGSRR